MILDHDDFTMFWYISYENTSIICLAAKLHSNAEYNAFCLLRHDQLLGKSSRFFQTPHEVSFETFFVFQCLSGVSCFYVVKSFLPLNMLYHFGIIWSTM